MNLFRTRRAAPVPSSRRRSRGQVIVIFAGAMLAFMGLMAIVIDVSWYWANTLRVQRAADAAALAGVVWLPNLYSSADTTARAEAKKNGYEQGVNGATITTAKDPANDRKLVVTISAPVPSFFARVVGIQSFQVTRTSKAEFILPVAMGSPENYYGVFGDIRGATFTGPVQSSTPFLAPTAITAANKCSPNCNWVTTNNIFNKTVSNNSTFSSSAAINGSQQVWGGWNLGVPGGATVNGLEIRLIAKLDGGVVAANCTIGVQASPNGGTNWYPAPASPAVTTSLALAENTYTFGTQASTSPFGVHTWVPGDFGNSTTTGFMVRLQWNQGSCAAARFARVDTLNVRVTYTQTVTSAPADKQLKGPGTTCANGLSDCLNPDGSVLNYRGFWGTMNTEGAANVNGDAFQPYYDTPTSTPAPPCPTASIRACYDAFNYYNYAIDMPANSTGGYVYIFDPEFCATAIDSGTGDRWFGGSNGISSWYELYDTNNTPYNLLDDTKIVGGQSGAKFTNLAASDSSMGGSGGSECEQTNSVYGDGRDYHDSWYLLNPGAPLSGGTDGTVYRLHTTGTDPLNGAAQRNANGEQSFAIYASASIAPSVYGLGAMQMFSPLSSSGGTTFSEFYIAQVPAAHAGKTLELSLWDPGDTKPLNAVISIEIPTSSGWSATSMNWTSVAGTSNGPQPCSGYPAGSGNSITTNVGNTTGTYNGCWLTIDVSIPPTYTADQSGWWKIRYTMTGSGTSSDVTTWTAKIRGNPVHLVLP